MKFADTLSLAILATPIAAQDLCEGNGHGAAYIDVGPGFLGGYYELDLGSPNAPLSLAILSVSDGFAETTHPVVGPLCLNTSSGAYNIYAFPTDAAGNVHLSIYLPPIPAWIGLPPFYSNAATFEAGAWSLSKTAPLWFENPNSWSPVGAMAAERILHTTTFLGTDGFDGNVKVLAAGGGGGTVTIPTATSATELFDPLSRTFSPGPSMSVERSAHTATRLFDGRVLLAGGLDSSGVCHRSSEIYDPAAGTLAPTGNMTTERAGHTATLLDDGRVLVTGGFQDYQNPATAWQAALNSAQSTAEVYDPATGAWTALAAEMSSARAGHTATKLDDGRVLLAGGVFGGGLGSFWGGIVPFFTAGSQAFDPITDTFSASTAMPFGRGFHGASLLASGDVLITGGLYSGGTNGEAISTNNCIRWNGTAWINVQPLPVSTAWHTQLSLEDGRALVCGGLQADGFSLFPKAFAGVHDGTSFSAVAPIGMNVGDPASAPDTRGAMSATLMHDGALLLLGGTSGVSAAIHATGYVYTPNF